MNKLKSNEKLNTITRAWIFDVDGVITNPKEKKVTEPGLIDAISRFLENGDVVTLNTGRSLSWIKDRVVNLIEESLVDKNKLDKFLAVGEKGGDWLTYQGGEWVTYVDKQIKVPKSLQVAIKRLIDKEFKKSMFYDDSKLTMISTEMLDGYSISDYTDAQGILIGRMGEILLKPEYKKLNLKIDPTTIATDIQNEHVGKHFGARRIADWLNNKNIKPQYIYAIGDSQSDTEMVQELQDEYSMDFVFVGEPSKLNSGKLKSSPIFTKKIYGEGTLEFLQSVG